MRAESAPLRFSIIGLGRFGEALAKQLMAAGAEVIAVDRDAEPVDRIRDDVTLGVRMDATDAEAIKAHGVHECDAVVIGIGNDFESAAMTVVTLSGLKARRIVARARTPVQSKVLRSIGAHDVVLPEREAAVRWAHRLSIPRLSDYVEIGEGYAMVHVAAPQAFHHKTLRELNLRREYGVNVVAISRTVTSRSAESGEAPDRSDLTTMVPTPEATILPDDVLIFVGSNESLSNLPG